MTTTVKQLLDSKEDEIFSIEPGVLVIDAIKVMNEKKVGALPVIQDGKLVGILSERDYTRKVILNNRSSSSTTVSEIMTANVKTVEPSQTIEECMVIMSDNHIRHLPVVQEDAVVGVLSVMDVVKNIITEKEFIIEQLEQYITA